MLAQLPSVQNSPTSRRVRGTRLEARICSLSVCSPAPVTPSEHSEATRNAPEKFASDPPPEEAHDLRGGAPNRRRAGDDLRGTGVDFAEQIDRTYGDAMSHCDLPGDTDWPEHGTYGRRTPWARDHMYN